MLTIVRVEEIGKCVFCGREKEVVAVVMDGKSEVLLCWADIKKHAQMRMRMAAPGETKTPNALPTNGAVAVAK